MCSSKQLPRFCFSGEKFFLLTQSLVAAFHQFFLCLCAVASHLTRFLFWVEIFWPLIFFADSFSAFTIIIINISSSLFRPRRCASFLANILYRRLLFITEKEREKIYTAQAAGWMRRFSFSSGWSEMKREEINDVFYHWHHLKSLKFPSLLPRFLSFL